MLAKLSDDAVLALIGTIVGGGIALASSCLVELWRQRRERNEHRAAMVMQLTEAVFECRHYLNRIEAAKLLRQRDRASLVEQIGRPPIEKASGIISLYFRAMIPALERLTKGMQKHENWVVETANDPNSEGKALNALPGYTEARKEFLEAADDIYSRIQTEGRRLKLAPLQDRVKERIYDRWKVELR